MAMENDTKNKLREDQSVSLTGKVSSVDGQQSGQRHSGVGDPLRNQQEEFGGWAYADAMRRTVDQAPEAFWQVDQDLRLIYANPAFMKISGGCRAGELTGKSLFEFLTPEGIEEFRYRHTARQKEEEKGIKTDILFFELKMRRMDGTYLWAGVSSAPIRDAKGRIIGYQGILRDIGYFKQHRLEKLRLEELLRKMDRMASLGQMSGSVAHELNNIMSVVLGYSELMMLQFRENGVLQDHLKNIIDNTEKAAAILQDVMMMSRKEDEGSRPVNINSLILTCLKKSELQEMIRLNGEIDVQLDLEACVHEIIAAAAKLEKALTDLLSLSIVQAGDKGRVLIKTQMRYLGLPIHEPGNICEGEYVTLSLTDTGEGLSDEAVVHLFDPFYMKKILGRVKTGLELPIVREVVKDHDGFINVRSTMGEGTTYTIYLPVMRGRKPPKHFISSSFHSDESNMIN